MTFFNPRISPLAGAIWALGFGVLGCRHEEKAQQVSVDAGPFLGPLAPADQVRVLPASEGANVASIVRVARDQAKADGRELLVYVGATWCEPCRHFHEAASRGDLDKVFPNLTLIEFDLDKDRDRLRAAGYAMSMIPFFSVPKPDGTASDRNMEGSVKGERAVADMAPRLRALLVPGG